MELETIRLSAAAAADATIGVNAMIAALPLDTGDVRPPNVTIYNAVDHAWVARATVSQGDRVTFPALAILLQPVEIEQVITTVRDADIPVVFAYLTRDSNAADARRDALYTNRAILRFLRRLAGNDYASLRTRNGVQLINPVGGTQQGTVNQPWDKAVAVAATVITWRVRETAA